MRKIRAGVIGTGFVGPAHIEAVRRSGIGEVIAIAGSSEKVAKAKASELGIDRAYGNYMDLIKDSDVQVVHNCTPNNLHLPINRAAMAAGKHIVSEKPLALDSREARLLLNAAQRSGVVHAVMFNYRHYPLVAHLRAVVQAGELGKIFAIHGSYLQDWLLYESDYNWRVDPALGGPTRAVADIGSHWCDLVQFITGLKITEVTADLQTVLPTRQKSVTTVGSFGRLTTPRQVEVRVTTEDYASMLFRFQHDARGALTISQVSAGRKNRLFFQIDGSAKSAAWDQEQPETLWFGFRDRPNETMVKEPAILKREARQYAHYPGGHGEAWADGVKNFMCDVYRYISQGKKPGRDPAPFATFEDGYRSSVLLDKILTSSRQRRWVKVNVK
ncbi:MAG: gfo/Idh/MocA family oxidoreductase [Candidatus Abyssobacteria bacterium SURF_17]|uniref:Gfo/Idh/MocA family oxidoreductase n=1 Tax=Candidatus Abyssobacteria bacterium SURF_17 TaxID=2093361 RepID=A0A419F2R2_9BACT|nr:MAG: gfo/Idh/MocA family oxidoreductase [Candidatus Abyssubacteria bacterium SURF_17]